MCQPYALIFWVIAVLEQLCEVGTITFYKLNLGKWLIERDTHVNGRDEIQLQILSPYRVIVPLLPPHCLPHKVCTGEQETWVPCLSRFCLTLSILMPACLSDLWCELEQAT